MTWLTEMAYINNFTVIVSSLNKHDLNLIQQ